MVADEKRTRVLEAHGYRVLRFWNNDVLGNVDGVLEEIQRAMTATPTPIPPHKGEGKSKISRPSPADSFAHRFGWA